MTYNTGTLYLESQSQPSGAHPGYRSVTRVSTPAAQAVRGPASAPRSLASLAVALAVVLSSCAPAMNEPPPSDDLRLRAVVTFSILADLVERIGGDDVVVHMLVGPGLETHTFEALPSDSVALAGADVILGIGLGFETWLPELVQAAGVKERLVEVGEALPGEDLLRFAYGEEQGDIDPHIWQDPLRARALVSAIAVALAEADPERASTYHGRAQAYAEELEALDHWIVERLADVPTEVRRLVTTHDALGYFADRYRFTVVGSAFGLSGETASPSAQDLAELVDSLRAHPVPAAFGGFGESNQVLNQIADEAGIAQVIPLYADSLGSAGSEGETYLGMMRYNAEAIAAALSP